MADSWLKRDAKNRAWRVMLKGFIAIVLLPALDAALQVVVQALTTGGAGFNWGQVGGLALSAALTAVSIAAMAYVHRLKIDPIEAIPSALPPRPPGVTAAEAPATAPTTPTMGGHRV